MSLATKYRISYPKFSEVPASEISGHEILSFAAWCISRMKTQSKSLKNHCVLKKPKYPRMLEFVSCLFGGWNLRKFCTWNPRFPCGSRCCCWWGRWYSNGRGTCCCRGCCYCRRPLFFVVFSFVFIFSILSVALVLFVFVFSLMIYTFVIGVFCLCMLYFLFLSLFLISLLWNWFACSFSFAIFIRFFLLIIFFVLSFVIYFLSMMQANVTWHLLLSGSRSKISRWLRRLLSFTTRAQYTSCSFEVRTLLLVQYVSLSGASEERRQSFEWSFHLRPVQACQPSWKYREQIMDDNKEIIKL